MEANLTLSSTCPAPQTTVRELTGILVEGGRPVRLSVNTQSMCPLIQPGDCLIVSGARTSAIRRGDIVVVDSGGAWIAHRLIVQPANGSPLVTKGDNLPRPDPVVMPDQVLGVVKRIERSRWQLDLTSRRARLGARINAGLSRIEARVYPGIAPIPRRVLRKGVRVWMRSICRASSDWQPVLHSNHLSYAPPDR